MTENNSQGSPDTVRLYEIVKKRFEAMCKVHKYSKNYGYNLFVWIAMGGRKEEIDEYRRGRKEDEETK